MAEAKTCRSCANFEPHVKANVKEDHTGFCRRYPPAPGVGHPRVQSNDWCGEFKPTEK